MKITRCSDVQELEVKERIRYYEQELQNLTPPTCFREQVLQNVYHCLLENCYEQATPRGAGSRP